MAKTKNVYIVPVRKKDRGEIISDSRAHSGILENAIDFALPVGTPILAAADGKVVLVKDDSKKNGGKRWYTNLNSVIIKHKNKEYSEYSHLKYNGSLVEKGQFVKRGDIIGYSGNTGWSTQPHLHFQISPRGSIINPGRTL